MLVWAQTLLERSKDKPYVIALGDYNLRDYEEAYKLIDSVYTNAWTSVYPSEISPDGVDMSGENRIDHIFFSPSLSARNPVYVLPPEFGHRPSGPLGGDFLEMKVARDIISRYSLVLLHLDSRRDINL